MAELAQLQRLLLDLISPRPVIDPARLTALTAADWESILRMVRQHRLAPLLHWLLTRDRAGLPVPARIREELAAGFKRATLRALVLRRELVLIHRLLTAAGIPCLALKGAFLAFHAYPQPGLRPLRDLDILVPADEALRAFDTLIAGGLVRPPEYQGNAEAKIAIHKHLPPLRTAPGGVTVEVHARLNHPNQRAATLADPSAEPAFWQRAIDVQAGGDTLRFPAPTDMLLHLIVHAAVDHKFDNGPLILSDIAFLLERQPIDWPRFWQAADQGRLQRACWLTLRLVEHHWGGDSMRWPAMTESVPGGERALEQASLLMLRDLSTGSDVKLAHTFVHQQSVRAKFGLLFGRLIPSKARIASGYPVRQDSASIYLYYIPHLWRLVSQRIPRILKLRRQTHVRGELELLNDLQSWLAG
ncbi:hypothetical protein CKO25_19585 [Thiocapsa imhoffii]|uniref:Nucleotidyltransferase family protein n=1 Tax=Thiocapsa imhoffii TaxID=382777 RepID=A0A9X0WLA1_9GAMM|nr:nucleotidyltransferase family protein [Thiocapsa imhoffii]MBK1646799.1 hypothetical protein [Thiocapsa imhoffii]